MRTKRYARPVDNLLTVFDLSEMKSSRSRTEASCRYRRGRNTPEARAARRLRPSDKTAETELRVSGNEMYWKRGDADRVTQPRASSSHREVRDQGRESPVLYRAWWRICGA